MSTSKILSIALVDIFLLHICPANDLALAAGQLSVVAVGGEDVPGGDGTYRFFNEPALNDLGQAVYFARFSAPNGQNEGDYGIFLNNGTDSTVIVRTDQVGPGDSGNYGSFVFAKPSINELSQVHFRADLLQNLGDAQGRAGSFLGDGNSITSFAVEGQSQGGIGFRNVFGSRINDQGQGVFIADAANNRDRIFVTDGTTYTEIARLGVPAPNGTGNLLSFQGSVINNAGQVAYLFSIALTGSRSIYLNEAGALTEIATSGQPFSNASGSIGVLRLLSINESGQVAFSDDRALAIGDGSSANLVVRSGEASPDGNGVFQAIERFQFNNAGQIAFRSTLRDTTGGTLDDLGIFYGDQNGLITIAREGFMAPSGNGTFNDLSDVFFDDFAVNDAGQIVFEAQLSGSTNSAYEGIFFYDPTAGLLEVVRRSDPLLGSTIRELDFIGGRDEASGLNELGQVAFQFRLQDGREGIAIWSIPEPSSIVIALACISAILSSNRRTIIWCQRY